MQGVQISNDFGIVIRKASLELRNLSRNRLLEMMEVEEPLDEDDHLLSFGPHFGEEAAKEFIRRLESGGLVYLEDFFDFTEALPQWCGVYACHATE